ncbi:tail fiber domain-containing protein [Emticicia sp. BO119]|uniref:tail fiber domain-containing protein n=1 Tax=Emticicia sp. BO119 TaxID=2757768 RepID=UPI0015F11C03|nr:tail fiber domain-containing protein [Emticicia sp. BO119]MBA4850391.1 tail fiber domain-containing protein [Emticicia sp. BO119]
MNTSIKLKKTIFFTIFSIVSLTQAFPQSVTLLPKSQINTDTLSTRFLRMTNGAGMYKVMVSDPVGNGTWMDPTIFSDPFWAAENEYLYLIPSVNLGIGTNTPAYKLDVRHPGSQVVASFRGNLTNGTGIRLSSGVTGTVDELPVSTEWQLFHSGTGTTSENGGYGQLHFKDQNSTKMILRNNGRVGIGVLNPSEMLEVNGNARINGRIDIHNTGLGVFIGEGAGKNDDLTQKYNTFIGFNAGAETTTGSNNLAIGAGALETNKTGGFNVAIGRLALVDNISGGSNVAIGSYAGHNSTGSYNVFIGDAAGSNAIGNDKLYIHNSGTDTPLIYGDFLERNMGVNGRLIIGSHTPLENASKLDVIANENARFIVQDSEDYNNAIVVSRLFSPTNLAPQMRFQGVGNSFIDIGQDNNGSFVVEGGESPRMVVTNAGKVGVGTDDPESQLEIFGSNNEIFRATSTSNLGAWFKLENTSLGGKSWKLISTGSENSEGTGNLVFKDETTSRMIIKSNNGAVGIGTENPSSKLEIVATTNETIRATSSSTTGTWLAINNTSTNGNNWKFISTGSGNSEGVGHLILKDNTGSKVIVKSNGAVGIGTETPTKAKLVVNGSLTTNLSYGYLNNSASTGTTSGTNYYSIYTSDRIATSELNVYSDARIKKIKGLSDNAQDLDILKNIKVTDYQLIDSISKGNTNYKKVIAQQIEEVYPSAVTKMTDFVPDIYQLSFIEKGFIPLTQTTLKAGDKLKLISEEKQETVEVLTVSDQGIQVSSEKSGKVFVYGKEVNDFRTVDYEALTTLNISATQQLLTRIETLEKENQRINQLAQEVESLKNILLTSQKGK